MQAQTLYKKSDYDFAAAAKKIGLAKSDLERDGQIERMLRTGVSSALPVKLKSEDGRTQLETTARLALGSDPGGKPQIKIVLRANKLKLDRYRGINIDEESQKKLKDGENVLLEDKGGREYVARVDKDLNRVAGWRKSSIMVPNKLAVGGLGETKLRDEDMASLKRGVAIETQFGGAGFRAQIDPVRRELVLTRSLIKAKKVAAAPLVTEVVGARRKPSMGVRL